MYLSKFLKLKQELFLTKNPGYRATEIIVLVLVKYLE